MAGLTSITLFLFVFAVNTLVSRSVAGKISKSHGLSEDPVGDMIKESPFHALKDLPKAEAEKYEGYLKKAIDDYNGKYMTLFYNERFKDETAMMKSEDGALVLAFLNKSVLCFMRFRVTHEGSKEHVKAVSSLTGKTSFCVPRTSTIKQLLGELKSIVWPW